MTPAFTPEQLAGVFVTRWRAREMANEALGFLRSFTALAQMRTKPLPILTGKAIKFRSWR